LFCSFEKTGQSDDIASELTDDDDDGNDSREMMDASEADDNDDIEGLSSRETDELTDDTNTPTMFHAGN